jgi:glycosyltransferase involved in cell wall biosynthesis
VKIAFVNQPIDTILPPYQSSVGACTYGLACALTKSCEVVVYGTRHRNHGWPADFEERNVHFRFFPAPLTDRLVAEAKNKYSKLVPSSAPASSSDWLFRAFGRQVAVDLRLQSCDVIHVQHCSQYLPIIRDLNPGAKIVLQLHAEWFSQNRPAILKKRLRDIDLLTTVSDYITEKTRRQFPAIADRCQTMYNAVDAAEFSRDNHRTESRSREKRLLYAGALSPHKGIHVLLDAFCSVVKEYPEVRLDIVGSPSNYPLAENFELRERTLVESIYPLYRYDWFSRFKAKLALGPADAGTYLAYLKQRLSQEARSRVAFHGFVPRQRLIELYYEADVFAFAPIWDEGFGIPPVEAMAAGVPVVASRSGAIPETVKDNETGFLTCKNDPASLAAGILKLLCDDALREKMGRAARARVHENFVWDRVAEKTYACYSELCAAAQAGSGRLDLVDV